MPLEVLIVVTDLDGLTADRTLLFHSVMRVRLVTRKLVLVFKGVNKRLAKFADEPRLDGRPLPARTGFLMLLPSLVGFVDLRQLCGVLVEEF